MAHRHRLATIHGHGSFSIRPRWCTAARSPCLSSICHSTVAWVLCVSGKWLPEALHRGGGSLHAEGACSGQLSRPSHKKGRERFNGLLMALPPDSYGQFRRMQRFRSLRLWQENVGRPRQLARNAAPPSNRDRHAPVRSTVRRTAAKCHAGSCQHRLKSGRTPHDGGVPHRGGPHGGGAPKSPKIAAVKDFVMHYRCTRIP